MAKKIAKGKRLIGHEKERDIYDTKFGELYEYLGKTKKDYENAMYWKKIR